MKEDFYYLSSDRKNQIHAILWEPTKEIKGVIQIAHGVTEYILRYNQFAEFFTKKGFIVVGNDHLGHGDSINNGTPMYFGEKGSWNYVVEDFKKCKDIVTEKYPSVPYFILGFSLGSFVVRNYLINYPNDNINGAIIIGTGLISKFEFTVASEIAKKEAKKFGFDQTTPVIHKLTFDTYNKKFAPNKTDFDWLTSWDEEALKYTSDTKRGGDFTTGLFIELLNGMLYTSNTKNIRKMKKNIPILLISGGNDPVGKNTTGVSKLKRKFIKSGIKDTSLKIYPNCRHDILHEKCYKEAYEYIENWLSNKININKKD